MKKITIEEVKAQQKQARKIAKANGNRVQLWYNAESGQYTFCELTGNDYIVSESKANFRIPFDPDNYAYEFDAGRKAELERQTKKAVNRVNAYVDEMART